MLIFILIDAYAFRRHFSSILRLDDHELDSFYFSPSLR